MLRHFHSFFFFFNDTATTEIYTLSLHDALPIYCAHRGDGAYAFGSSDGLFNLGSALSFVQVLPAGVYIAMNGRDRKSTRLNSSHGYISYAVFCLKKKKTRKIDTICTSVSLDNMT